MKTVNTTNSKQKKLWLIDKKKGEIIYDVTDDVNQGWWHKLGKDYGGTKRKVIRQGGEFVKTSQITGMQWFDHHSQAYNDSNRRHPQRHEQQHQHIKDTTRRTQHEQ